MADITPCENTTEYIYSTYFDMVYRICFVMLGGNAADTEDAVQTVFMKYIETANKPAAGEHTKAWLIVTAKNTCLSFLRLSHRKNRDIDAAKNLSADFHYSEALDAVMHLPRKEKLAVYLCLYEEYTAAQAAKIMGCKENTVYSYIHRARKKLQRQLGE